jgi:hypothetical protein
MFSADMEKEREDEDSVCSPSDLPECRSGPPNVTQPCARQGVLGGPSQPQPSGRRTWEMAVQGKIQAEPGPHCGGGEEAGLWPLTSGAGRQTKRVLI